MLRSSTCNLYDCTPDERIELGEGIEDPGGYFIVNGNERVLIGQLRNAYNRSICFRNKPADPLTCDMRSMSEETGHSVLIQLKLNVTSQKRNAKKVDKNGTIDLIISQTKTPIPIGFVFRVLKVATLSKLKFLIGEEEQLQKYITLILKEGTSDEFNDLEDVEIDTKTVNEDDNPEEEDDEDDKEEEGIDEKNRIEKEVQPKSGIDDDLDEEEDEELKTKKKIKQFIEQDMFPHLGVSSTHDEKAIMLGKMVRKLLIVNETEIEEEKNLLIGGGRTLNNTNNNLTNLSYGEFKKLPPRLSYGQEDRDNYSHKRVEMAGVLCFELFRMLYKRFIKSNINQLEKRNRVEMDVVSKNAFITTGLHFSFSTGNWGVQKNNYIRTGVAQIPQNKVSFGSFFSYLRRFVIPMGKEGKNTKIRQIHPSSIFFACPSETPEGQFVGVTLNLSMLAEVSLRNSSVTVKEIIEAIHQHFVPINDINLAQASPNLVTIFVNGGICGVTSKPALLLEDIESLKCERCLRHDIGVVYSPEMKEVHISSDAGRFIRPLINLERSKEILGCKKKRVYHGLNSGFGIVKKINWNSFEDCLRNGVVVYKDAYEIEQSQIAIDGRDLRNHPKEYDSMEIHPSCMMGVMAAQIPFAEHTQSPRLCYQASMAKQAIGNIPSHHVKSDNTTRVMDYIQRPLVSTQIAEMNHFNDYPNGINAMVAVAIYSGFNQEDSIILNKASIDRGMFHVITYKTVVVEERKIVNEKICLPAASIRRMNNYSLLEDDPTSPYFGVVKVKSVVKRNDVVVGKIVTRVSKDGTRTETDHSTTVAVSEEGKVDRIIRTSKKGILMFKIVIAQQKRPEIGDKFCSDMAQKGTVGMILNEEDMPFMTDGSIPDMIINPHCLPSRMTINQIMASIMGKVCCAKNEVFGDASPFREDKCDVKDKIHSLCKELEECGYNYNGTETMMNGFTGERLRAEIFFGPVYYHRLTHMVSDKIFSRASTNQKRHTVTRQPLNGRANEGGLRIGEMEKDCMLVHGASKFLHEKMFDQSDKFIINLCVPCKSYYKVAKDETGAFKCTGCNGIDIVKFNFPFAAKLVFQELTAMGQKIEFTVK
jgi:DNA-directed RNA polymerase II subunit RPB2